MWLLLRLQATQDRRDKFAFKSHFVQLLQQIHLQQTDTGQPSHLYFKDDDNLTLLLLRVLNNRGVAYADE